MSERASGRIEPDGAGLDDLLIEGVEPARYVHHAFGETGHLRRVLTHLGIYIAPKGGRQQVKVNFVERGSIGLQPAVEHAGELLHPLRYALVADPQLPDGMINVLEEGVDDFLRDFLAAACRL